MDDYSDLQLYLNETGFSDPNQERDRLRLISFVAYGALKALAPENEVTKWIEGALWPKSLVYKEVQNG